jgi:S1-C subfamily serine protease
MREIAAGLAAVAALLAGCGMQTSTNTTTPAASPASSAPGVAAQPLENTYEKVISDVLPSIVQINTKVGLGSGIVYDTAGHIVTNAHVVGEATEMNVTTATGGAARPAKLVKSFSAGDLAVIKVWTTRAGCARPSSATRRGCGSGRSF